MNYQHSITILSDGKTVIAIDNKTETEATARCSPSDEFNLSIGASLAIERLLKNAELKTGDVVRIKENFSPAYDYPFDSEFVEQVVSTSRPKTCYCYSVSRPPLSSDYIIRALSKNKAFIQTNSGWNYGRCYVVDVKILEKVN